MVVEDMVVVDIVVADMVVDMVVVDFVDFGVGIVDVAVEEEGFGR